MDSVSGFDQRFGAAAELTVISPCILPHQPCAWQPGGPHFTAGDLTTTLTTPFSSNLGRNRPRLRDTLITRCSPAPPSGHRLRRANALETPHSLAATTYMLPEAAIHVQTQDETRDRPSYNHSHSSRLIVSFYPERRRLQGNSPGSLDISPGTCRNNSVFSVPDDHSFHM